MGAPNPEPQTCQSPPLGRADIPAEAGDTRGELTIPSIPQLRPVSQVIFLATGLLVPASSLAGGVNLIAIPSFHLQA
jgi:hypothetical protein